MQVCQKHALYILPPHIQLVEALQSAATCVEKKFLPSCLHEDARSESIHDSRGGAGTQECNLDFLRIAGCRDEGDREYPEPHHYMKDGQSHIRYSLKTRDEMGRFPERQLLKTFADQAVIAIANTKLFEEVQAPMRELLIE